MPTRDPSVHVRGVSVVKWLSEGESFEVRMFGRRSHARFSISPSSEGALRVLRDVILQPDGPGELVAIGRVAGVVGETLTLEIADQNGSRSLAVRVLESRPVVIDGAVRHHVRLEPIAKASGGDE